MDRGSPLGRLVWQGAGEWLRTPDLDLDAPEHDLLADRLDDDPHLWTA